MKGSILIILLALPLSAETKVGMVTRSFVDDARQNWEKTGPRPLRTSIWYPAADSAEENEEVGAPLFDVGRVAPAGEISKRSEKYPLVLISHGTGGSALTMMWLGRDLASRGSIVAAVNHHGNTSAERKPAAQGFMLFWERPKDLTAVLDRLLADPLFGPRIDRDRIGAVGFSLGGYTVISSAGGIFSMKALEAFCNSPQRDFTCEPQPEFPEAQAKFAELKKTDPTVRESLRHASDSYRDKRIKAVFAIAPALGSGFTTAGLKKITIPIHIVVGEGDTVTPLATNAQVLADRIKGARLTVLPGAIGHYTFLAECTPTGKAALPICRDAREVDRGAAHRTVGQLAWDFLARAFDAIPIRDKIGRVSAPIAHPAPAKPRQF